jgi:predicted permease
MMTLIQDLRYALRQLRHAPGFALSVVLVLALGIGANAAMFTILEATLFRPLPYRHVDDLVRIKATNSQGTQSSPGLPDLLIWQQRSDTLSQIAYYNRWSSAYIYADHTQQKVSSVSASPNLFATLGVAPALGRSFTTEEQQPGKDHIAVLSDVVWRNQFHADPHILGQTVRIDDTPTTIIGVMPQGFLFPADDSAAQIWVPSPLTPKDFARGYEASAYDVIARRHANRSMPAIAAELNAIQKQILPLYSDPIAKLMAPAHLDPVDYRRSLNAKDQRTALLALFGAVMMLWLIACANVACLMLARTTARRREMAVRAALGASPWRLVRQTLAESLLLSLIGGIIGLILSQLTLHLFRHNLTTQLSPNLSLHPDARVLLALFALSVLSAVLFSVVPSRLALTVAVDQAIRQDGAQAGTGRHQHRLQRVLVVSELSLTLVMLVSCGLLLRTVFALRHVPLGFRTDHIFVIEPHLPGYKYDKLDPNTTVYKPLLDRLKAMPGIQSAAITTVAPLESSFRMSMTISFFGKETKSGISNNITATMSATGPELQRVLGFGMLHGRYFNAQDTPDSQPVGVVNQAFAKIYTPVAGDVMGYQIGDKDRKFKIVGIIDDFHQVGIADPAMPEIYLNAAQMRPTDGLYQSMLKAHVELVLRSSRDSRDLIPELNHVMQQFNPDLAGTDIRTMDQIVDDAMGSQLLAAHLLEALGALALIVALAGLYSLLAYLVTLRTRELGLRLALGAQREDILALVLRGAALLLLTGTALGLGLSLFTARLLHSFLFGVRPYDIVTLLAAPILLLLVGAVAAWLPARRAAALEPMQALRTE